MARLEMAVRWHLTIVVALISFAVAIVVLTPDGQGFNFLLIVPMLSLVVVGLPWSVASVFLAWNYLVEGDAAFWAIYTAPALANVVLHALVRAQLRTRRARQVSPDGARN